MASWWHLKMEGLAMQDYLLLDINHYTQIYSYVPQDLRGKEYVEVASTLSSASLSSSVVEELQL